MSKRHWLRDVIDFGVYPNQVHRSLSTPFDNHPDDCDDCNRAAQEIADSLALDGANVNDAEIWILASACYCLYMESKIK